MENNIIWLASYPKSGNTWFRSFLTALQNNGEIDINSIQTDGIFSSKLFVENVLDLSTDDIRPREFESYRKIAFRNAAVEAKKETFIKIHDAYTYSRWDGLPMISEIGSRVALYFIRNPLDVVLSMANHIGVNIEEIISRYINSEEAAFIRRIKTLEQYYQLLGTWEMHALSWINQEKIPVHVIRYEDMKDNPFATFKEAVRQMRLNYNDEAINKAIAACDFNKLKEQEVKKGFNERERTSSTFFFKGESGRWKKELTNEQIKIIMTVNESMMKRFGYWDEAVKQIKINGK